jgi:lysophospholipid acyltransferase (LPLAT)-like uncharacterized protein
MAPEVEKPLNSGSESSGGRRAEEAAPLAANPRTFTRWQRFEIFLATWVGTAALALIGHTMRWEVFGWEHWEAARRAGRGLILTFWHYQIFSATWYFRRRGIVVMTSRNFDGEYIARIITKLGYGAARGSSSRGGGRALEEMRRSLRQGRDAGFTIDGPRGPRAVAKPGSVILARATGAAIMCFHVVPRRAWILRKSWDRTEIPRPFTRAGIFIAPPIFVASEADGEEQTRKLQEVQAALDDLAARAEAWRHSSPKTEGSPSRDEG